MWYDRKYVYLCEDYYEGVGWLCARRAKSRFPAFESRAHQLPNDGQRVSSISTRHNEPVPVATQSQRCSKGWPVGVDRGSTLSDVNRFSAVFMGI